MYSVLSGAISLLVVWLFADSAWSKLKRDNRAYYLHVLAGYGITDASTAVRCLVVAGSIEGLTALAVVMPAMHVIGLMVASALLLAYLGMMALQMLQGKSGIDCGCSGPANRTAIGWPLLLRNLLLAVLTALAAGFALPSTATAWLLAAVAGLFMVFCTLSAEQLMGNQQKLQQLRGPRHLALPVD